MSIFQLPMFKPTVMVTHTMKMLLKLKLSTGGQKKPTHKSKKMRSLKKTSLTFHLNVDHNQK